ncbi:GntR family transcriptional regulator [Streptomyces sp. NPDC058674]|uniref:GntR family transcriptional regulator n=1 Tax=Streptomyces sp. NPDC058674 TaxID=3346592 RepID=UPI0036650518
MSDEQRPKRQPKYQRIADDLRAAIDRGEYGPGDRLPGEHALAAEYSVAVMTVRQAIGVLRTEGLVEARKGAGVFVQAFRPIRRRGIQRLARDHWGAGKSIWSADEDRPLSVDQVTIAEVDPPEHIADVLGLTAGHTSCRRSRRFVLDGRPVMLAASYLPQELVAGSAITRADTGPGGTYARLAELGHAPVHFREEIRCRMPNGEETDRLGIPPTRPVLLTVRTAYDEAGRAVEVNEMTMDSASYVLDYEFDA